MAAEQELAAIRDMLLAGQGDDDGSQILPDFEEGMTVHAMVAACAHLLERRRDVIDAHAELQAENARLRKGLVPEGWALVPREITPEMLDAAVKGSAADVSYADVEELWPVTLDAAPAAPIR